MYTYERRDDRRYLAGIHWGSLKIGTPCPQFVVQGRDGRPGVRARFEGNWSLGEGGVWGSGQGACATTTVVRGWAGNDWLWMHPR